VLRAHRRATRNACQPFAGRQAFFVGARRPACRGTSAEAGAIGDEFGRNPIV
jgi:hypothetical protein